MDTDARLVGRVGNGAGIIQPPAELRAELHRKITNGPGACKTRLQDLLLHAPTLIGPDPSLPGDGDVRNGAILHQIVQVSESQL